MESPPDIKITLYGKTDVGLVREHNEDSFLIADSTANLRTNDLRDAMTVDLGPKGALFLVCDGMGGAAAGEVASQMAVESIATALSAGEPAARELFARRLRRAIEDANDKIYAQSRDNQNERGMGTTCTAAALVDGTLVVGQIGDSRCYVLRRGKLAQVTKDQSLAWQLIEAGAMTPEDAKQFEHANIILQALGVQERVDVVLSQVDLRRGDVVLISSDGLHGPVSDEEIGEILREDVGDLRRAGDRLIARAIEREGPDNVTVVLARFDGEGLPAPEGDDVVQFVAYDPGRDPSELARMRSEASEKETQEVTIPKEFIRMTGHRADDAQGGGTRTPAGATPREGGSVMAFVFIALLAALAALLFLRFDRARALEQEREASSPASIGPDAPATPAAAAAVQGTPPAAPAGGAQP